MTPLPSPAEQIEFPGCTLAPPHLGRSPPQVPPLPSLALPVDLSGPRPLPWQLIVDAGLVVRVEYTVFGAKTRCFGFGVVYRKGYFSVPIMFGLTLCTWGQIVEIAWKCDGCVRRLSARAHACAQAPAGLPSPPRVSARVTPEGPLVKDDSVEEGRMCRCPAR